MGLYEESRDMAVVGKTQRPFHQDSSGALQYTPDLRNVYFQVNERCIRKNILIWTYLTAVIKKWHVEISTFSLHFLAIIR